MIQRIATRQLIEKYARRYGYDAEHCFAGISEVGIYRCDTGLGFYYPFSVAGDASLYEALERFDWNYKIDKWEYQAALTRISANDKVLDVGCGEGRFLSQAAAKGASATGIELNRKAASVAAGRGCKVSSEMLSDHQPEEPYDVVTAFQVLEHVTDPLHFISDCLRVLRSGGCLIIGVPNNDSFLRLDDDNILNQPPHHMGLWNRKSLTALAGLTGLTADAFETEPLAEPDWYQSVIERKYLSPFRRRLYYRLGFAKYFQNYVRESAHTIAGHTIIAVLRKGSARLTQARHA